MKRTTLCIAATGGWGDVLLCTPVIRAMKESNRNCRTIVFCAQMEKAQIFRHNPYIDCIRSMSIIRSPVSSYLLMAGKWTLHRLNYANLAPSIFPTKSAIEVLAEMAEVQLQDRKVQFFLSKRENRTARETMAKFRNPVCIEISSHGRNKIWPKRNWEELIKQMPGYTFIQLGPTGDPVLEGAVNLIGKTSFRQAAALIKNAYSFVGVDSGSAHLTNAFGIPGVVLFGPSSPQVLGHPNNINIYKKVRCSPCADILGYAKCPYGEFCMNSITVEEVKQALTSQLSLGFTCS